MTQAGMHQAIIDGLRKLGPKPPWIHPIKRLRWRRDRSWLIAWLFYLDAVEHCP